MLGADPVKLTVLLLFLPSWPLPVASSCSESVEASQSASVAEKSKVSFCTGEFGGQGQIFSSGAEVLHALCRGPSKNSTTSAASLATSISTAEDREGESTRPGARRRLEAREPSG